MMFTDETISFTRLEDLGMDNLTLLIEMAALPYRGPLLTDCMEVEGECDDIFIDNMTVGEVYQIEEILRGGNIGIACLYKNNEAYPAGFLLNLNPINTANFLAKNLLSYDIIQLSDLYGRSVYEIQKDAANDTYHHRCQDTHFAVELLDHLDPLLKKEKPIERIPCVATEKYELYNDTMHGPDEGISPAGLMMGSLLAYATSETTHNIKQEPHLTACWKIGSDTYVRKVRNTPEHLASYILNRSKEEGELSFRTDTGETVMVTSGGYILMCKDGEYLRNQLIPAMQAIVTRQSEPICNPLSEYPTYITSVSEDTQDLFLRQLLLFGADEATAMKWISWSAYLAELDQSNGDPEHPKTAEMYLSELLDKFSQIQDSYGVQIARAVISLGKRHTCLFPWELNNAAKHLAFGGSPDDIPKMASDGLLEGDNDPNPDIECEPSALLYLFEQYEQIPRDLLAHRAQALMEKYGIRKANQPFWLAELLGTTRNTTYSWFAPNRDAKIPLKVIAQLAYQFKVSIDWFAGISAETEPTSLRKHRARPSYEEAVWNLHIQKPELSPKQIAEELGIACETVRRHLLHCKEQERHKEYPK